MLHTTFLKICVRRKGLKLIPNGYRECFTGITQKLNEQILQNIEEKAQEIVQLIPKYQIVYASDRSFNFNMRVKASVQCFLNEKG
jgi:hypothetical protein